MASLTIGQLADRAGVGVETVRFYEREGLLETPPKGAGFRHYPEAAVQHIRFIRRAKELGFALKEIKELLTLRASAEVTCDEVRQRADAKIADIEARIRSLQRMRTALVRLAEQCPEQAPADRCPILAALAEEKRDADR